MYPGPRMMDTACYYCRSNNKFDKVIFVVVARLLLWKGLAANFYSTFDM